jgi:hypothetical protein
MLKADKKTSAPLAIDEDAGKCWQIAAKIYCESAAIDQQNKED